MGIQCWRQMCAALVVTLAVQTAFGEPAEQLFPFHAGGKHGKWGYINVRGEVIVPSRFREALDFSEGLARVQTDKGIAYIDVRDEIVFMLESRESVDWTRPFFGGLAAFSVKGKCGYFDRQGKIVIEPKYDDVADFSEGLAAVNDGAISTGFPRSDLREGGKWGFIDAKGKLIIPRHFGYAEKFSEGLALVSIEGERAYINRQGKIACRPIFKSSRERWIRSAHRFVEGFALINIDGQGPSASRAGFIDRTGNFVIEPTFSGAGRFSEGLAAVRNGEKSGYIDRSGRIVIEPKYDAAAEFSEGLAAVKTGKHWSFVDKQGKVVIAGTFNHVQPFRGGLARVHEGGEFQITNDGPSWWAGGTWFYINHKGEKVHKYCHDNDVHVHNPPGPNLP